MRAHFAKLVYEARKTDNNIIVLTGDLGYKMWDKFRDDFPESYFNVGAAEGCMVDIAIGLALSGKTPIVYTITPFLYRAFEALRTYVSYENIPVKLIGAGRDKDYAHDGVSHWAEDVKQIFDTLPNIKQLYPANKLELENNMETFLDKSLPVFINLPKVIL